MTIFISYRRADSMVITDRIYEKLGVAFGKENIFRDICNIPLGVDFRSVLVEKIQRSDVMLVILGKEWLSITGKDGKQRLFDPGDFVRLEVASGLSRQGMRVIPVVVMGATLPSEEQLPDDLKGLAHRNAVMIRNEPDFMNDIRHLCQEIGNFTKVQKTGKATAGFSLFQDADLDSIILTRVSRGAEVTVLGENSDWTWLEVALKSGERGWALAEEVKLEVERSAITDIPVGKGFGARSEAWKLFFTAPGEDPNPGVQYGIDVRLADAIGRTGKTLDIAAFEFNNTILTEAVLEAHNRGIGVRIVTQESLLRGMNLAADSLQSFREAGIPVMTNEEHPGSLMHNKFMILDGQTVWTGSWNYTMGSTYRNNENTLVFDSPEIAAAYRHKFETLFTDKRFGRKAPRSPGNQFLAAGIPVEIYFAPADEIEPRLLGLIASAVKSVKFMVFSFTSMDFADALIKAIGNGAKVQGIVEARMNRKILDESAPLLSAGVDLRPDTNRYFLHHTVMVIDEKIVITGSLNFSLSSLHRNDENLIIVHDPDLAGIYLQEFERLWTDTEPVKTPKKRARKT